MLADKLNVTLEIEVARADGMVVVRATASDPGNSQILCAATRVQPIWAYPSLETLRPALDDLMAEVAAIRMDALNQSVTAKIAAERAEEKRGDYTQQLLRRFQEVVAERNALRVQLAKPGEVEGPNGSDSGVIPPMQ